MKISVVTVCFNSKKFIEFTFESILNQSYKNIEYIVIDGGSTDGTLNVIKRYEKLFNQKGISLIWTSEKDKGMYDALNKGFKRATGDIFCWINSDDFLMPWTFSVVAKIFDSNKEVKWLTGIPTTINESNIVYNIPKFTPIYLRSFIKLGLYNSKCLGFIQQESTFWSRSLWEKSGNEIDDSYNLSGDYVLWKKFSEHAELYTVDTFLAGFRTHSLQLSSDISIYYDELRKKEINIISIPVSLRHLVNMIIFFLYNKKLIIRSLKYFKQ